MMNTHHIPFEEILMFARLAPSGDNMQPWFFEKDGEDSLLLFSYHLKEAPSETYYSMSGTPLSVGTVLESTLISARHFGFDTEIIFDPYFHEEKDYIAKLRFTPSTEVIPRSKEELFDALPKRRTNRWPFSRRPLESSQKHILEKTVEEAGGILHFIEGEENLKKMGKLWGFHDDFYWYDDAFRETFATLIHTDRQAIQLGTGMTLSSLGLGVSRYFFKTALLFAHYFPSVRSIIKYQSKKMARKLAENSSAFGFIFLPKKPEKKIFETGWEGSDFVQAGRIVQRLWLRVTALGLALQPTYTFVVMVGNEENTLLGEKFSRANKEMLALLRPILPRIDTETLVFTFRIGYPTRENKSPLVKKDVDNIFETEAK